jgi:hypothetical protein
MEFFWRHSIIFWSTSFVASKTPKKQPSHGLWSYLPATAIGYEKQSKLGSRATPPKVLE